MKRSFKCLVIISLLLLYPLTHSSAYNPSWKWKTIQTDNFTIYYPEGHEKFAQRIYLLTEEVYGDITKYFGTKPPKCPIVINPGTDLLNGFYAPFPNRISLYETPPFYLRGFGPASDIADAVFTHEFTHFVHITAAAGWYKVLTRIAGDGLAISNILSPGWIIEGITTNTETIFTDGGRGRCSYFKGQILSCTEGEGLWNLSAAGTYSPYVPPANRFYLAGYHMVKYLNDTYGEDAFARLSSYQSRHPVLGIHKALKHVTGKSASIFYKDFTDYLNSLAKKQKAEALKTGLPQGKTVFSDKYDGVVSHFWTNSDTIIALRSGYEKKNVLLEIQPDTGSILSTIKTGRIYAIGPVRKLNDNGDLIFSAVYPHILGDGNLMTTDLTGFNTVQKKFTRITKNNHIYSADISPDKSTLVATQRNGMWIDLILADKDGNNIRPLFSRTGYLFEAPVWSPDGKKIAVTVKTGQNSDIALIDPDGGALSYLFPSDIYEDNDPSFSPDGNWLVFSSNRKGIWNVFAWHLKEKKLFQLTSEFYGATEPRISPDGKTVSFLSLKNGLKTLCTLPFAPDNGLNILQENQTTDSSKINFERVDPEITFSPSGFPLFEAYRPYLHIPYISGDDDRSSLGIMIQGRDPVGINSYSGTFAYTVTSDISNTAGTAQEEESKDHFEYNLFLANNSFWPTLQMQFSDEINEGNAAGNKFWYKENTIEFSVLKNFIWQLMPSSINTTVIAGGRYRHQKSLSNIVSLNKNRNDATSLFGKLLLARYPDFPKRDIIPTHGQEIYIGYEKGIKEFGDETDSMNAVVSFVQYLPSFFKHNGIGLKAAWQKQEGLSYSKDLSLPRGYSKSDSEGGLNLSKNLLLSGEYHFPIVFLDNGLGLSALHIHAVKSSVFFDYGAGWDGKFDSEEINDISRKSIGVSLTCRTSIYALLGIETGVEAGYKIEDKEGFASFVLMAAF